MQKADLKILAKPLRAQLFVHERHKLMPQGTLAVEIARSLSLAAIPDGETSTGEQKHRLLTVSEIVEKATAVSELVYSTIEAKGWLLEIPSIEEIEKFDGYFSAPGFLTKGEEGV